MELYVVGGKQKQDLSITKPRLQYETALVLQVNTVTEDVKQCFKYITPPGSRAPDPYHSISFKSATFENEKAYLCTETEILIVSLPDFTILNYISLPSFNDLHHVRPTSEENLLVVSTGLDMVMELTPQGKTLREWNVLGEEPWKRFSRDVDYRRVITKPHESHPNYVFQFKEEIWVTRFEQRDAICLTNPAHHLSIDIESPHDGYVRGNLVYFTTVNGFVVICNILNQSVEEVIDLNHIVAVGPLGWCRGLMILDDEHIVVGFTRIRQTKFRENILWVREHIEQIKKFYNFPSRLAIFNIRKKELCWEKSLEEYDMNQIFSIHLATT